MRCKKHLYDVSSTVGVCASCLRDRLLLLIEKQSEGKPPIQFQSISNNSNPNPNFNRRQNQNQQQQPPPLIFPRSVSPYICPRKSEPIQRFYAIPQVNINPPKKKLGLIARLFRSRSITSSSSNSTNSTLNSQNSAVLACRNKGMSPENELDYEMDERETSESSPASWMTRPSPARVKPSPARTASLAFCLSPLVRASPARNWKGEKSVFSGEIRVTATGKNEGSNGNNKPHLSNAASFCANRSRKLADFGRLNLNR